MSVTRFNNYANFNPDVVKDLMEIAEKIEKEQENVEPDTDAITKLRYQQLIRGMELNAGINRNYGNYYKPF